VVKINLGDTISIKRKDNTMQDKSIGIIGVGVIGERFTRKIIEAELPLRVYDIRQERMELAVELGAKPASSAKEVTEQSYFVILCLPGSPPVEAAMSGPDGILAGVSERQIIIDTGTTRPATDIEYAAKVRERGGRMVDAPITGRRQGFIIMVGGTEEDFFEAKPVLEVVGYKVAHIGPLGYGQRMKLVNQFILAGQLSIYSEAVVMAKQLGLNPEELASVLEFQATNRPLHGNIQTPGAQYLFLHTKDMEYLSELLEEEDIYAPLTEVVTKIFQETRDRGEGDWNQTAVVTHWKVREKK
jgi:2-hydroxy-3-oxopropionate reductase